LVLNCSFDYLFFLEAKSAAFSCAGFGCQQLAVHPASRLGTPLHGGLLQTDRSHQCL
jgi:hypothetical protein